MQQNIPNSTSFREKGVDLALHSRMELTIGTNVSSAVVIL